MRQLDRLPQFQQEGFMAIVLVVFLVVFVAIAAAVVSMSTSGSRTAADHVQGSAALYLAESGIEWAARELFDTDTPQAQCEGLEGQSHNVNDGGTFLIVNAVYNPNGNESCRVTSRGQANPATRTIVGVIPKRVMDGSSGGDDVFDDSEEKFNNCGSPNIGCEDGELIFSRPGGGGQGQPPTESTGEQLISDEFEIGDEVFFTANIGWDADPTGNVFGLEMGIDTGADINCDVSMPNLGSGCNAAAGHPLYDQFDIVLALGDYFGAGDVGTIKLRVDWEPNASNEVVLSNGCIGREGHCSGGGDDPTDDDGWDEDP